MHHPVVAGNFEWPYLPANEADVRGTRIERADRRCAAYELILELDVGMVLAKTLFPVFHRVLDEDVSPGPDGSRDFLAGLIGGQGIEVLGFDAGDRKRRQNSKEQNAESHGRGSKIHTSAACLSCGASATQRRLSSGMNCDVPA